MRTRICAAQRRDTHFSKRSVCARGRSVVDDCTSLSRRDALIDRVRRTIRVDRSMRESRSRLFDDSIVRTFGREWARSSTEFQVQLLTGCPFFFFFFFETYEWIQQKYTQRRQKSRNEYVRNDRERKKNRERRSQNYNAVPKLLNERVGATSPSLGSSGASWFARQWSESIFSSSDFKLRLPASTRFQTLRRRQLTPVRE